MRFHFGNAPEMYNTAKIVVTLSSSTYWHVYTEGKRGLLPLESLTTVGPNLRTNVHAVIAESLCKREPIGALMSQFVTRRRRRQSHRTLNLSIRSSLFRRLRLSGRKEKSTGLVVSTAT